jgi:hypothetical protein
MSSILRQAYGGAPVDIRLDNETAKGSFQLGLANSAVALYNRSGKVWDGRGAGPSRARETLVRQDGAVDLFKLEDTAILGSRWSVTGFVSMFDGSYSAIPFAGEEPEPLLGADNVFHRGWFSSWSSRGGRQWRLFGTTSIDGERSDHDLTFGAGQRVFTESSAMRTGRQNLFFQAGSLFGEPRDLAQVMRFGRTGTRLALDEAWWQDTVRLGHYTLGVGLRLDQQSGTVPATHYESNPTFPTVLPGADVPEQGPLFRWRSLAPRLGIVRELGRDASTVLGASYSRFASQLGSSTVSRGSIGYAYSYVFFADKNGDHLYQDGEPYEVAGTYASGEDRVDPGLAPQMTDALALSLEQRVAGDWRVRLDLSQRVVSGILESRQLVAQADGSTRAATRDDYVFSRTVGGTLPDGREFSGPIYVVAPTLKPAGRLLLNSDRQQVYRGATVTVDRAYRNGWMLRANATLGDWRWKIGSDFRRHDDPTDAAVGMLLDGYDPTDTDGEVVAQQADGGERKDVFLNSGWSFNVTGSVEVAHGRPWSFLVASNVAGRQGYPIPYAVRTFGTDGVQRWLQATRRGDDFRVPDLVTADLRLEKDFTRGEARLAASLEVFNLFDTRVVLQRSRQLNGVSGGRVLETMSHRAFRAGLRVTFR